MNFSEYARRHGLSLASPAAKKTVKPPRSVDRAIARTEAVEPKPTAIVFKDFARARSRPAQAISLFGDAETLPKRAEELRKAAPWAKGYAQTKV